MTDIRPSVAVIEAVAREAGVDPLTLPPLYDTIDPDSLDRLVPLDGTGELVFRYHGYEVTVGGVDDIDVTELNGVHTGQQSQVAVLE